MASSGLSPATSRWCAGRRRSSSRWSWPQPSWTSCPETGAASRSIASRDRWPFPRRSPSPPGSTSASTSCGASWLRDRHLRPVHHVLVHAELIGLPPHPIAQFAAELLAALRRKGEADTRADQAPQGEDADGAERRRPGAAALLEAERLEHVILVDVLQVLDSLQPPPTAVLDHDGLQERPARGRSPREHSGTVPGAICARTVSNARACSKSSSAAVSWEG